MAKHELCNRPMESFHVDFIFKVSFRANIANVTLVITFGLGFFAWDRLLGTLRLGSFAWEYSFGILRLGTFTWQLSLGKFRLGSLAWEFSLGNFRLGNWAPDAGGTG